jgi:hypothetical protein
VAGLTGTSRWPLVTAALACAGLAVCACGSARPAARHSAGGFARRYAEAPAMLVQCGFDRGVVSPGGTQPWYRLGTVLPQSGDQAGQHAAEFAAWWRSHSATTVAGRTLSSWQRWAAQHDKLPAGLCGAFAPTRALHAQIFPGQPSPWRH